MNNYLIETVPVWPKEWYVEIKFAVHSLNTAQIENPVQTMVQGNLYDNIFHFTTGENYGTYGTRFPALWTSNSDQKILVFFDKIKSDMVTYERERQTFALVFSQEYKIRIEHKLKVGEVNHYVYQLGIDGVLTTYDDWNPPDVSNVHVFVGDEYYKNSDATINYLDYGPL